MQVRGGRGGCATELSNGSPCSVTRGACGATVMGLHFSGRLCIPHYLSLTTLTLFHHAAAHGGQVTCEKFLADRAMSDWSASAPVSDGDQAVSPCVSGQTEVSVCRLGMFRYVIRVYVLACLNIAHRVLRLLNTVPMLPCTFSTFQIQGIK